MHEHIPKLHWLFASLDMRSSVCVSLFEPGVLRSCIISSQFRSLYGSLVGVHGCGDVLVTIVQVHLGEDLGVDRRGTLFSVWCVVSP